jgi:hypothetical protein
MSTLRLKVLRFSTHCSAAERSIRLRKKGGKLSESREKRDEFLTAPRSCASRGEPKAKLPGAFSLVRFFGARKEMNVKKVSKTKKMSLKIKKAGRAVHIPAFFLIHTSSPCPTLKPY